MKPPDADPAPDVAPDVEAAPPTMTLEQLTARVDELTSVIEAQAARHLATGDNRFCPVCLRKLH